MNIRALTSGIDILVPMTSGYAKRNWELPIRYDINSFNILLLVKQVAHFPTTTFRVARVAVSRGMDMVSKAR